MSVRTTEIVFLLALLAAGGYYLYLSFGFLQDNTLELALNPGLFPALVSGALILLIIVSLVQSIIRNRKDKPFPLENLGTILSMLGLTLLYLVLWDLFNELFYILTFLFALGTSLILSWRNGSNLGKLILRNGIVAGALTIGIFVVFEVGFGLRMT